ncbi:MAG: UPF0149 family protein [Desulfobulbaceae bacterium]|nr:MAG: UPF0149 family protein [Desulfobulbaceae bacterium]
MKPPVTARQKKILTRYLALSPDPDDTFTYDELMGYLFGIAITPDVILPGEWMDQIFGEEKPVHDSMTQAQEMLGCLMEVYNAFSDASRADTLHLPFNILTLKPGQYDAVFAWVFGFNVALSLRPDIWEPEDMSALPEDLTYEVMSSLMIIEGLIDPEVCTAYFEGLPGDILREAFGDFDAEDEDLPSRHLAILLASLPMAVEKLQEFARLTNCKRLDGISKKSNLIPFRSARTGRNAPCPGNGGKKSKKCCGKDDSSKANITFTSEGPAKKGQLIRGRFPGPAKITAFPGPAFQLKVSLVGSKPPIWRRILVPGTTSLADLHAIIQACMGWTDSHLHHFAIRGELYAIPDEEDEWYSSDKRDERDFTLDTLGQRLSSSFLYVYDMGDYWEHRITVEQIVPPAESPAHAVLLTGRRACPPEDSGGIASFQDSLKILADAGHEEYRATRTWFGAGFRAEHFDREDIASINLRLKRL